MTIYAILCEMLPDRDGNRKIRMHSETFTDEAERDECRDVLRRQNLPFAMWNVSFDDPRAS